MAGQPFTIKVKEPEGYRTLYPLTTSKQVITDAGNRFVSDIEKAKLESLAGYNRIINPLSEAVSIWQRGTVFSGIATWKAYCADRWWYMNSTADYTLAKGTDGSIKMTSPTKPIGVGAILQDIEGGSAFTGQKVTTSFLFKTNTKAICLLQGFDSSGANVWGQGLMLEDVTSTYKRYVHTPPSIVPKTVNTLQLAFYIYSEYPTGAVEINLKEVKVELGDTATPFVPRPYAEELALCQRYMQIRTQNNINAADLRPSMRIDKPTVIDLGNGRYLYDAEIY